MLKDAFCSHVKLNVRDKKISLDQNILYYKNVRIRIIVKSEVYLLPKIMLFQNFNLNDIKSKYLLHTK